MKRKGFTLIELLAVIVILAIIALIAVPVIMNIISSARKSAFEDTAYGLIDAGEMYYASSLLENGMASDVEFTIEDGKFVGENKLEVKGALPTNGKIIVTKDGRVAIAVNNGAHCVTKATSESRVTTVKYEGSCEYKKAANPIITSTATCITNANETCSEDAIKAGIAVNVKVNDKEEAKTFYVVKDDATTNTLTLIMDRNIGETVAWVTKDDYISAGGTEADYGTYGSNNKGPITALNYLESKTSSWTNIPAKTYTLTDSIYGTITRQNARARMLTEAETFSLDCVEYDVGCPVWLYGNLESSNPPYAYWLSSASVDYSRYAWGVDYDGTLSDVSVDADNDSGVRPVIEIPKTII
ncbi:MAG: DUF1566 domain-containing protein [Firmicutes bacterium]|nr:DUF1566 domain-containing protein [Bacillota bacterium]